MTTTEERPTIAERYATAVTSSHLKMGERRGDLDTVIAAGLVPDGLAIALFRLSIEYDAVRGEHRAAEARMRIKEAEGKTSLEAEHDALIAHVLILGRLGSLKRAKELFGEFAVQEAIRRRFMQDDRAAQIISGRALDAWIRPQCGSCDGRGFLGGSHRGEMQTVCRPCRGSGNRRESIGKSDAERGFAGYLLMRISELMAQVQRDIRSGQRLVDEAKRLIAEAGS